MVRNLSCFVLGLAFGLTFTTATYYGYELFSPKEIHQEV